MVNWNLTLTGSSRSQCIESAIVTLPIERGGRATYTATPPDLGWELLEMGSLSSKRPQLSTSFGNPYPVDPPESHSLAPRSDQTLVPSNLQPYPNFFKWPIFCGCRSTALKPQPYENTGSSSVCKWHSTEHTARNVCTIIIWKCLQSVVTSFFPGNTKNYKLPLYKVSPEIKKTTSWLPFLWGRGVKVQKAHEIMLSITKY